MATNKERIVYLWRQYLAEKATLAELEELINHIQNSNNDPENVLVFQEEISKLGDQAKFSMFQNESWEKIVALIAEKEKFTFKFPVTGAFDGPSQKQVELQNIDNLRQSVSQIPRIRFWNTLFFRYAAAIIIVLGLGVAAIIGLTGKEIVHTPVADVVPAPAVEVLPGSDKAVLTLSDGKMIALDSSANAVLQHHGIANADGMVSYMASQETFSMNTLTTPRGGQFKLRLNDGTMVWLNAASSITYPTFFKGRQREVSIIGEAYFEVAKNPAQPFIVHTRSESITVIGTRFNVSAYPDESFIKTSLVEGSIKVDQFVLTPGTAYAAGKIIDTDILQDIAWKNGYFNFNGADLPTVMRQLSRWYDIEVKYPPKLMDNKRFGGKMGRDLTLSQVLKLLSSVDMHFKLEGRTVIVSP